MSDPIPIEETITVEELLGMSKSVLTRSIQFEIDKEGKSEKLNKRVIFRRLTFMEISNLSDIPTDETERYTRNVVFMASLEPKFESIDIVAKLPHGFVRHYSELILYESGKSPFLSSGPSKRPAQKNS